MPEGNGPPPLNVDRKVNSDPADENAFLWFDGILEGPIGDRDALRAAVLRLDAIGIVNANLEIDGGRFSVLLDDRSKFMNRVTDNERTRLVESIQAIVDMSPSAERVESTLRCTEVNAQSVHETLFAVKGGKIERVSRARSANSDDLLRRPRPILCFRREF